MAVARRVGAQLGANCGIKVSSALLIDRSQSNGGGSVNFYSSVSYKSSVNNFDYRQISQLAKHNAQRAFLVDTLALAEAITSANTEVLNDSLENVAHSSRAEMQKSEMIQEGNLSKFKSEVQSSLEHHFSLQQRETEKLRNDIEKMRSELRLEEFQMLVNELTNQNAETTNHTNKLDREIHALRAQIEASKYEVIKYCISAVGLAVLRLYT
ncbi:hypothetical protein K7X08_037989 [Anisodus acutangulus]|uniref:Uncharacterized protein n=1 Tax=Anisodus acutangulus TaxID=402998 RepID=A0A9Q1RPX2_9SOLA|nr:hypothetical protein K7X08_037989 [Anisodus acutangulus]